MPEELAATYTPVDLDNIRLIPRSSRSFDCNDQPSLEAWCIQRRYMSQPTRGLVEYARLRKGHRLIVLYNSGSVVCQGDDWAGAIIELQRFVVEVAQ